MAIIRDPNPQVINFLPPNSLEQERVWYPFWHGDYETGMIEAANIYISKYAIADPAEVRMIREMAAKAGLLARKTFENERLTEDGHRKALNNIIFAPNLFHRTRHPFINMMSEWTNGCFRVEGYEPISQAENEEKS